MKKIVSILIGFLLLSGISGLNTVSAETEILNLEYDISTVLSFELGDNSQSFGSIGSGANETVSNYINNTGDVTIDYSVHTTGNSLYKECNPYESVSLAFNELTLQINNGTGSHNLQLTEFQWRNDITPNGNSNQSFNISLYTNDIGFETDYALDSLNVVFTGVQST